jgi:hypothetical protein
MVTVSPKPFILVDHYLFTFRKLTEQHIALMDDLLTNNPELSSVDLARDLQDLTGVQVSDSTIRGVRAKLGWTYAAVKYCQLVS